ncbi:MAG: polyphosphate--AMP phosphotransferase [Eggerthella sp.]|nr:polyphosphate--AMP phosphotransferase [Eggerthella sp.]
MLDTVRLGSQKVSKKEYKVRFKELINKLVVLQQEAKRQELGVVVLFEGWKGAGKGSRISDLLYHLDARDTSVYVTEDFEGEEAENVLNEEFGATGYFPVMQQFWKALGQRGSMTFYDRGWYSVAAQHVINMLPKKGKLSKKERAAVEAHTARMLPSIEDFETQLRNDGYLVIKFFLHISEQTQRERLVGLYSDPATKWRVTQSDLEQLEHYSQSYRVYDEMLKRSNFKAAPWILLDASDHRRVNLSVAQTLVTVLERELSRPKNSAALEAEAKAKENSAAAVAGSVAGDERERTDEENQLLRLQAEHEAAAMSAHAPTMTRFIPSAHIPSLDEVDHSLALTHDEYKLQLKAEQERLRRIELEMYIRRVPMMIMYEGWDAAGKGGSIKRVAQALDARSYTIFPSPAPTKPELLHPHLWRYWTRLPKAGHVGIYDRSWYGRVLVERVEGFASTDQWSRAYEEINEFERDMVDWGAILLKFWVDISPETQLQRFEARENNPAKSWKITAEDWRNRDKYPQYRAAVDDMFRLTSTHNAPWIILESDDKYYARVKALRIINEAIEKRLGLF